ncbi:hypothetical protein PPTG_11879 [Phytophthora nicotianae INRA-310]|uniref:Uncharacterized protein n=1 Tax=Phytophthora nicotianae (strain INRA-310) TaxID=761204 RepID=W2Q8J8_PHYN3|nr:hypothetical protein PPTG_11879 [Phytophthora nicotianae INRA-310]ETN09493.1 hypothetical protein PPTG_11879 [Phytophthora nicotianae INRA-310]
MEVRDTSHWHRKWIVLLGILGWLFLYRYRVTGFLLSKAVTFQLSKSRSRNSKLVPVTVRVERVSLQPLRFFNVELSSNGSSCWRVILTKVEVQSHVKEFFESFGLVKICVLAIDEIIGDVEKIDEEVLRDALLPKKTVARDGGTRPKMNPICYMRFVDLTVQSIRLRVNCMETMTKFLCQGLYVGITDVFVQRDMLQLKVQTKSMAIHSSPQVDGQVATNDESDGSDGLRVDIPNTSAVLDLNLRNQRFLGCKVTGCEEQTTSFTVSTAFLERALTARNEVIRKGLAVVGDVKSNRSGDFAVPPVTPSEIEIDNFSISITVVNEVEPGGLIPIQFCADVRKLRILKQLESLNESCTENEVLESPATRDEVRIQVEALVRNARVHNLASKRKMVSVCSIEVHAKQTALNRGLLTGAFEKIDIFLSHRSEKIFRSLIAAQERVKKCQVEAKRMLYPSIIASDRLTAHEKKDLINWDAEIEVTAWMLSFKAFAKGGGTDDFTVYGMATSIQTPLAPVRGDNGSSFIIRSIAVQHITVDVAPNGLNPHSAVFGGVKLSPSTCLDPAEKAKTTEMSVKFEFVSINGLLPDNRENSSRFPAIYLHDVKVDRKEKITDEVSEVDMDIHLENTNVKWPYREHKEFLLEWAATKNIIDQLDLLLSSSSKKIRTPTDQAVPKILSTNVYSKDTAIDVMDIPGVAPSAAFCLTETKVNHRATQLCVTTAFNSANASVCWGEKPSAITLTNVSFQNRSSIGRQRYLTKVPIQSDIRCSSLKAHLRPQSRMLLLFLRLDQLTSGSSDKTNAVKQTSVQGISFVCGKFTIELEDAKNETASIEFDNLGVKMTRCTPREVPETITRVSQCLETELTGRSFAEVAQQVMTVEGTASASAITAVIPLKRLVELQDTELHFSITDVEWSRLLTWENDLVVPRTTSFDLSMLTERIHLAMERKLFDSLFRLIPILQEAFDTKEPQIHDETIAEQPNFRLRFVGNVDIAFQNAELTCPYGDKDGREQIGSKVTRVLLGEVAFNLRQFQVMGFKCSPLRVMLEDADFIERIDTRIRSGDDSLQLLFIPEVSVSTFIHWQHGIHYAGQLQFALSSEIALGHTHSYDPPTHVPIVDEALVSLNWDCVVPWLIYMITDDNGEYPVENSIKASSDEAKRVQCVGVQWDLSVNSIQFAWWDTATQDIGMLVVANEFLTHGLIRLDSSESDDVKQEWKLWEATVYLHLFRGYLLHVEDDFVAGEKSIPEILPFGSEMASNFSLETVGTSYRNSYTPDEDENWEVLDEQVTVMFAPSNATIFEKMHDAFVPIDYEFGISTRPKLVKQDTPAIRLPMLHVPSSVRRSSAAISPPKSPRSAKNWTQNIKSKLSLLNRRSASMDNLFLKDGSCPIQVDSMRLLWTLQTRDSVFYMVSTTVDSLRLILDTKRNAGNIDGARDVAEPAPLSPPKRTKRSSFRPPSVVSNSSDVDTSDTIVKTARFGSRRGSTRDTLLDLLQQGKLGMTQEDRESSSKSIDEESESTRESIGEDSSDYAAPKTAIAMKAYTVDIHDVQINVREENTRSNVLVASKHIHFEIGTDASDTNTIANVTFDNVTAHVAPIDVDISAGVLWYSHSNTGPGSALLKQIMEECSLTSSYTHTQSTGATSTEVDLSFLQPSTDRHQFYQLMNVIRHVLLAPPSVARRPKRTYTPRTYSTESPFLMEGSDITVFTPPTTTNTLAASTSAKKLHVLLEEELRNREIRTRGTSSRSKATALKAISFKVVGMQWKLRLSPEITGADHEFVGIRITGFTGCHTYFTNHCTKLTLNLQWLEINNLHPGPSSVAFEDPTAVLKAKLLVDKRLESSTTGNQKGMLVVRAESGPIVRVHGQKLRVLEVLEVSMFPEVSNMIVIQLAADFYELIYKFFFENISPTPQNSEQVFLGRKSTYGPASPTASSSTSSLGPKGGSSPFTKSRMSQTSPQNSLRPLRKSNSANSMVAESAGPNSPNSISSTDEIPDESDSTATDDCELFYVKYVRVGNVRLRINCNGFFVNLSNFDLDLPPYICQSKLCTSKKLLQKFESHLKWYITKESASSGLSQFKNKLLKWTPASSSTDGKKNDKSKKQEEDTAAANAQVLFGPYSGTST